MASQLNFADFSLAIKPTRRAQFLTEMDQVIPWTPLLALIAPHYPAPTGAGRRPIGLATMLRIYFLQQWFNLSDPAAEEALCDSRAMAQFVGLAPGIDAIPDETTICKFRHRLEQHDLPKQLFAAVGALLEAKGLFVRSGTIVDATIIDAPSSTKNATQTRDPEMRQTKKGNQWYFGMKIHIGTDPRGLVHSLCTTDAAAADISQVDELLHGTERTLYGDRAYWKDEDRARWTHWGGCYRVQRRGKLTGRWKRLNRARARIRAFVEHPFLVVKRLWGFTKVRYRGLAKNTARAYTMFALANLYRVRRQLRPT
jgi:IS5 family transposase